jgi:hypothetical protein
VDWDLLQAVLPHREECCSPCYRQVARYRRATIRVSDEARLF